MPPDEYAPTDPAKSEAETSATTKSLEEAMSAVGSAPRLRFLSQVQRFEASAWAC
jgi:hypothetical protein